MEATGFGGKRGAGVGAFGFTGAGLGSCRRAASSYASASSTAHSMVFGVFLATQSRVPGSSTDKNWSTATDSINCCLVRSPGCSQRVRWSQSC
ncbi:UNVERIFIED_CONTAM: hypothetical protein FKN15_012473 [Acipenser sinensis]